VESAGPAVELWRLAQLGGTDFDTAFEGFLQRFGARGPDEYELANDTWGTRPGIALAAIERLRHAQGTDPAAVQAELAEERRAAVERVLAATPAPPRPLVRRALRVVAEGAAGRELAKGTVIEALYAVRLALFELVRRAQGRGAPAERRDCFLVTRQELPSFVTGPAAFAGRIAERAERHRLLQGRTPPFVFEGSIPDPSSWPLREAQAAVPPAAPGDVLSGLGVSPGVATGTVRVVRDPVDPAALSPGDVLVAPITDPAWTPLFLVAEAVVVDVGANMSHAAIVARELGIPGVMSVDRATERLPDGARVRVDGTEGTVTLLA
jgi:pyruvate,water dikinase